MVEIASKIRKRDHAMILLAVVSGIIIWLLWHRKVPIENTTIVRQGSIQFPSLDTGPINIPDYFFDYQNAPLNPLQIPVENIGIENCACGCTDSFETKAYAPGPRPVIYVSNPATQEPVIVVSSAPAPSENNGWTFGGKIG